jgi:hypothetical protein
MTVSRTWQVEAVYILPKSGICAIGGRKENEDRVIGGLVNEILSLCPTGRLKIERIDKGRQCFIDPNAKKVLGPIYEEGDEKKWFVSTLYNVEAKV